MSNGIDEAGLHITMDAYVKDAQVFTEESIRSLFVKLVDALSMKMLGEPHIYEVPTDEAILEKVRLTGQFMDEGGITGVAVISTSHMSIHCWPLQKFFSCDVFSCCNFDGAQAIGLIREHMGVSADNTISLNRRKPVPPT